MLFNPVVDRSRTQLAYEAMYYRNAKLSEKHKVAWSRLLCLSKKDILETCNEERTLLIAPFNLMQEFKIKWENNNVPTEKEWDRVHRDHWFFVDFRISPLIPDGGRVALIYGSI